MSADENTPVLRGCLKLPLSNDLLLEVTSKAKDYAIMHGAAMRSKTNFSPDSLNVSGMANETPYDIVYNNLLKNVYVFVTCSLHHSCWCHRHFHARNSKKQLPCNRLLID